ncbi:hypothetical protein [Devosia lacusdianchii]|uniref:hypothetical protein n=1 Tax=Devosia lacusdianchii TaxID=2917991 RepID=UPI001F063B2A|nr:hypothetical protein [Devosia sp. JXJ CY 41]
MKRALALAFTLVSSSVNADDIGAFNNQVSWCYSTDGVAPGTWAEIAVTFDAGGKPTAINVLRYQPDSDAGRSHARTVAEAIDECGPYLAGISDMTVVIGPQAAPKPAAPLITMPDNADGTSNSLANEIQKIIEGQ